MPLGYLNDLPWTNWSREERLFCAVLFEHARRRANEFAAWLIRTAGLHISPAGDWELGYEVCFYRDYLWQKKGPTAVGKGLSGKRTFDLCLFGKASIVIIEAKVCGGFSSTELSVFEVDPARIRRLDELADLDVKLVALASSQYLASARTTTMDVFDGSISWKQIADLYSEQIFEQAERLYGSRRGEFIGDSSA